MQSVKIKGMTVDTLFIRILTIFIAIFSLSISIISFFKTSVLESYDGEKILIQSDNLILNGLAILLFVSFLYLCFKYNILSQLKKFKLKEILFFYVLIIGTCWIFITCTKPSFDSGQVVRAASEFSSGIYTSMLPNDYIGTCPHQLGLAAFFHIIFSLFGEGNFYILQVFNVVACAVSFQILIKITDSLFENETITVILNLILFLLLPPIFYSSFVYGVLLGMVFSLNAVYQCILYLKKNDKSRIFYIAISCAISIMMKNNYLIVMIAILIVLLMDVLSKKKYLLLCLLILIPLAYFMMNSSIINLYESKAGIPLDNGVPRIAYITMGLEDGPYAPGWFNAYVNELYIENNYSKKESAKASEKDLKDRLQYFMRNPKDTIEFFYLKNATQWNEPTFESIWISNSYDNHYNKLSKFASNIYFGFFNDLIVNIMEIFHFLTFAFCCLYLIIAFKSIDLKKSLLLLIVIGGVIFHFFWEAKSQYTLFYFILLVPYATAGIYEMKCKLFMRNL